MANWHFSVFGVLLIIFTVLVAVSPSAAQSPMAVFDTPSTIAQFSPDPRRLEHEVFLIINELRRENSLPPLVWCNLAAQTARRHSTAMANFNFFSHQGQDGLRVSERAEASGLRDWKLLGENIAFNAGFENPVERAVTGWMNSAGHRKNILRDKWRETGVGVARTATGKYFFTQVFLKRK